RNRALASQPPESVGRARLAYCQLFENSDSISPGRALILSSTVRRPTYFVFSDFRHGIFNRNTIPTLAAAIPEKRFGVADSQEPTATRSAWAEMFDPAGRANGTPGGPFDR